MFFDSFFITKAIQEWGKALYSPWQSKWKLIFMKNQSFGASYSFTEANQECKEGKQREESNMKKSKRTETIGHISITSWSPLCVYYMSFRSSRSQESKASNGVQIGAEMKNLWPLEDNRTKLKDNFASCEINLRNQSSTCEMDNSTCEIFISHVSTCEIHLCTPRYLRPTDYYPKSAILHL